MKAGVDFGTTLVKAVWQNQDASYQYFTTADAPLEVLMHRLHADNISTIYAAGDIVQSGTAWHRSLYSTGINFAFFSSH